MSKILSTVSSLLCQLMFELSEILLYVLRRFSRNLILFSKMSSFICVEFFKLNMFITYHDAKVHNLFDMCKF